MIKKSDRVCIYFKREELGMFNELCKRKGYFQSSFIKDILVFCAENDCTPAELSEILKEYKEMCSAIDDKNVRKRLNEVESE